MTSKSFHVYPAMDLYSGEVVRLFKGDFKRKTVYSVDPLAVASGFVREGARYLHVVDLSAAEFPDKQQLGLLEQLAQLDGIKLQVGGGLRSVQACENLLEKGVDRVVVGSMALSDPAAFRQLLERWGGDRLTLALDCQLDEQGSPQVLSHGWQVSSGRSISQVLADFKDDGLTTILCTDVGRDGVLSGPNVDLYTGLCQQYPDLRWLASGGVSHVGDLGELKRSGAAGVVIGKALYEKRFGFSAARSYHED